MMRRIKADESGFTVLELAVVMLILLVVTLVLGNVLISLTKASNSGEALIANEQQAQSALTQMGRDLRAASPLFTLASASAYSNEVKMTLVNPSGGAGTTVAWFYDTTGSTCGAANEVCRQIFNTNGTVKSTFVAMKGVLNASQSPAVPLFSMYGRDNTSLSTSTAATIATCTTRVKVQIWSESNPGPVPFQVSEDVQLRNQLASLQYNGNNPC